MTFEEVLIVVFGTVPNVLHSFFTFHLTPNVKTVYVFQGSFIDLEVGKKNFFSVVGKNVQVSEGHLV